MSQGRTYISLAIFLVFLIWALYHDRRNKKLKEKYPNAELQVIWYPRAGGQDRPNDKKAVRFDTLVFFTIVAVVVAVYIANSEGCR